MSLDQKQLKKMFLEGLERVAVTSAVCEKLNVSRATLYRWVNDDPEFKKQREVALMKGRELMVDMAESKLIAKVQEGDNWAIRFLLENNCKRYSRPDKKLEYKNNELHEITLLRIVGDGYDEGGNKIVEE